MLADWRRKRDALLASPRFRRWAATFPLTRPIARRRARRLFDLGAGFVYSQIYGACIELGLFERLAEGPRTLERLAAECALAPEAMGRLLRAAESLELVESRGAAGYGLGPLGAAVVGNEGVVAMVEHHRLLYADLADPLALLRGETEGTQLSRYWAYATAGQTKGLSAEQIADYSRLMAASQPMVAEEVLNAFSFAGVEHLMDVGGGEGAFLSAVARRMPSLRMTLFDLPAVGERARAKLALAGLAERVAVVGGDFFRDRLPQDADLISLVRIVHDHDDEAALTLLRAVRAALPPKGRLLLAEPMAETPGAEPVGAAYFGFYLLAMGSGRPRSEAELRAMLRSAGFSGVEARSTNTPLISRLLIARV